MPRIDMRTVTASTATSYPGDYTKAVAGRSYLRVGDAGGLTQFGVNIVILAPGAQSSLPHAHSGEDEFVMVLEGTVILETQHGEWAMGPGECAAFPAGGGEFHHFWNRTGAEARFLVAGTRAADDTCTYPDEIDMRIETQGGETRILHRDGTEWA